MSVRMAMTIAGALATGFVLGQLSAPGLSAQASGAVARPAYLVVSSVPVAPEKMAPYRQAATPLAQAAGLEMVAAGNPALHVLEGKWTLPGSLSIERYRSMDDLLAFWNSPGYQEAKKLRAGLTEMNFIVAIEGR